ncbi:MAG: glutathione S-transferase [Henriciella sp.]|nr:glutathione S-transferase [Henriciella sp.]
MQQLILGNLNYSSWSLRALLVLRTAGIAVNEEVLPLGVAGTKEKVIELTGQHRAPALVTDELIVHDSLAITEWAAEQVPAGKVWPADSTARARARSLCAEMHGGFLELKTHMGVDIRSRKPAPEMTDALKEEIERVIEIWTNTLDQFGGDGPFLFGAWSAADAFFMPVVTRFRTYGVSLPEKCQAYSDAVLSHPVVKDIERAAHAEPWVIDTTKFAPGMVVE